MKKMNNYQNKNRKITQSIGEKNKTKVKQEVSFSDNLVANEKIILKNFL